MIELQNISLQRGGKDLFVDTSLRIHPGEKTALIGANGAGKSTLFQLLLGELTSDSGAIDVPGHWRLAHMAQEVGADERSALDYTLDGDTELRAIETQLAATDKPERIAELHEQLDNIDGYTAGNRAEQLLLGLNFQPDELARPVSSFSGGWRIRLNLARALMCRSDCLLLDEPTNHLDLDAELWLENWLRRYPGTLLLISHDRDFIDNLCERVVHIDNARLNAYSGNYSAFERQRAERLAQQQAAYEKQQRDIAHIEQFITRFRAKATKAKQAQSRIKALERMERIAPAHVDSPFHFAFAEPERVSDPLLNLSEVAAGYGETPVLQRVELSIHPGTRLGLLGANGAGKSTLLKTLAAGSTLRGGERVEGEHCHIGYFTQHQVESLDFEASPLLHVQRLSPEAREQSIRDFLGGFDFRGDKATGSIAHFSGGEKARLALALIVWQKPNLLLLDEPTNHLDLEMCHALTVALQAFNGAVVVVSHDRHLLRNTADEFLLVHDGRVEPYKGDLDDYSRWLLQRNRQSSNETPADTTDTSAPKLDKKQQRQQAAEKRKQREPLRKQIKQTEKSLEKLQQQLAEIETQLSDSAIYNDDNKARLAELLQEQGRIKTQADEAEDKWLQLQEELEALD